MEEDMGNPQIEIPPMCLNHRTILVQDAGFKVSDPWQSLELITQVALFQIATSQKITHDRIGEDITKIKELGCLACWSPAEFSKITEMASKLKKDVSVFAPVIKQYGESFVLKTKPDANS